MPRKSFVCLVSCSNYAKWEAKLKEFERARNIFERVLEIDRENVSIWLKYATMEMQNRFINRARNVWDRAVAILPRVDQLWCMSSVVAVSNSGTTSPFWNV